MRGAKTRSRRQNRTTALRGVETKITTAHTALGGADMFHREVDIPEILHTLMENSIETMRNLKDAGYPLDAIPPHHTSVYVSWDEETGGVYREGLNVLTYENPDVWTPLVLHRLNSAQTDTKHSLGAFIGFVGNAIEAPDEKVLVGILISPTGEEAEGVYVTLEAFDDIQPLWDHPFDIAPNLHHIYRPDDTDTIH